MCKIGGVPPLMDIPCDITVTVWVQESVRASSAVGGAGTALCKNHITWTETCPCTVKCRWLIFQAVCRWLNRILIVCFLCISKNLVSFKTNTYSMQCRLAACVYNQQENVILHVFCCSSFFFFYFFNISALHNVFFPEAESAELQTYSMVNVHEGPEN